MKTFKAAIFDLDGTLAHTMPDLMTAMNEMLASNGLPQRSEKQLLEAINCGAVEFVRHSLPEQYQNDEEFVKARHAEYTKCYDRHYLDKTKLFDGIDEAIYYLKEDGMKLAVLSNKQDSHCKAIIGSLFKENTFDFVLGQTALPTKPDPTSAFVVAGHMDARPSETAYIGDSHIDMKTAINAGMYAVGVSWGYRSVDTLIENGAKLIIRQPSQLRALSAL